MCSLEVRNTKEDKEKVKSSCGNFDTNDADADRVGALTIVAACLCSFVFCYGPFSRPLIFVERRRS